MNFQILTILGASKLNNQIASWDTKFETGTKATLLLPFSPIVVAADENELIRCIWLVTSFLSVVLSQFFGFLTMGRLLVLNYKGDWFKLNLCDRVWNYEDAQVLNSFDNHQDSSEKGISKLCLINELDDNLLLAGSSASWSLLHFAYTC